MIAALIFFSLIKFPLPAAHAEGEAPQSNSVDVTAQQGGQNEAAARAVAEADELRARWDEGSLRHAVEKYEVAASAWKDSAPDKAAQALRLAGDVYFILSEYKQSLDYYNRALEISRRSGDRVAELEAQNDIGYVYIYLGENRTALRYATKVRQQCQHLPSSVSDVTRQDLEAQSLNSIGEIYYAYGDLKRSLKMFLSALELWTATANRKGCALAHLNLGYSYTDIGDLQKAPQHYLQALSLWQESGDRRGAALARTALGGVYSFLGDKQLALDAHAEALTLFRLIGNHQGEAAAINGVAQAYEDLQDYEPALENYRKALDLYQMIGHRDFVALNLFYIGRVSFALGEAQRARDFYQQSLDLSREIGDRQIEAHVLKGLGIVDSSEGNNAAALKRFRKVLEFYQEIGDRRGKAYTLNSIGHIHYASGKPQMALDYFRRALPLIQATEDQRGEALTLYNIARVEHDRANLDDALAHIKESISIIEASRVKVDSKDLRTAYFAEAHKHYELYIDLLMQMSERQPGTDYAAAAFLASEQARARSLLDMLTEEKFGFGQGSHDRLLAHEDELAQILAAKTEYRTRLLSGNHTRAEAEEVAAEIRSLSQEYEVVRARIREQNPRYAALTQLDQLSLQDIQDSLRSDDTLLLEFSLGDERSYLWAIGPNSVSGYELPGRAVIESAADKVYESLTARQLVYEGQAPQNGEFVAAADSGYLDEAAALSWILLKPVAAQLGSKRLLIVTDGALQHIPFEALPVPQEPASDATRPNAGEQSAPAEPQLLIDYHEIVELPSASVLAALRKEKEPPNPPAKTVAVLADPVFDKDDPRVSRLNGQEESSPSPAQDFENEYLHRAVGTSNGEGSLSTIPRLPASLREARAIMAVTPPSEGMMAVGFEANRARIMSEDLKSYRIIHFATHGILDSERPEMSGLLLSMVDKDGNPQNGYLRLKDIYGLEMRADLVVLSACRTGLGRTVQGEGLIGLTRGFMYAGSKGVVASLWKVDDQATAELMKRFYTSLLRDGHSPASALRAAKQSVRMQARWHSPYFWAAFVLQGEYNETFAPHKETARPSRVFPLVASLLAAAGLVLIWRRRKRSKMAKISTAL